MIQVSVKSLGEPNGPQLDGFKQYLAAPDTGNDGLLKRVLRSAMADVQEWEDQSLLEETITLIVAARPNPNAPVHLYRTVDTVTSVKDADGNDLEYSRLGNTLQIVGPCRNVEIVYETKPEDADLMRLMPKVYRVAAARYDGEDPQTINRILMEG